jgi:HSP20 family protein
MLQMGKITFNPLKGRMANVTMFDDFDFFEDWNQSFFSPVQNKIRNKTSIKNKDKQTIITAEIPGFTREEVKVTVKDNILSINAEKLDRTASFAESYALSKSHNPNEITAKLENGVLNIVIPIILSPVRNIEVS